MFLVYRPGRVRALLPAGARNRWHGDSLLSWFRCRQNQYFELRHAESLAPVTSIKGGPMRILVAARLGTTRLIDNLAV